MSNRRALITCVESYMGPTIRENLRQMASKSSAAATSALAGRVRGTD